MRNSQVHLLIEQSMSADFESNPLDLRNMIGAAIQANYLGSNIAGTFKLQGSVDHVVSFNIVQNEGTWNDIANSSQSVNLEGSYSWDDIPTNFPWIRVTFENTFVESGDIATIADTGVRQVQTVDTVADVAGNKNSTYFLLSSVNKVSKAQKNFYLWLDNGSGVDPAIAGRTGIQVTYSNGDSANTIATAIRAALNGLTNDFVATGSTNHVVITNVAPGLVTAAADGTAATGFSFANTTPGVASNLNNTYFLLDGADGVDWYVWLNVDSIGTDPAIAGRTGIALAFAASATANTIASALKTAMAGITSITTIGGSTNHATFDQTEAGAGALTDGSAPTLFTLGYTAGDGVCDLWGFTKSGMGM